ncbi:DUF3592 domain-containing protein [Aquipuribacter nitratireducens]|uniref:DUF3592 domain-containing protein n=1 Tax=Aquipuribacter nitratireducens TaxID=650104 RepID=A0ABW0GKE8_9MICO
MFAAVAVLALVAAVALVAVWVSTGWYQCTSRAWSGEDLDLPPSVVGRRDAEVLDVDMWRKPDGSRRSTADVVFEAAGRQRVVTWVELIHRDRLPEVGEVVTVAYLPGDPETAFLLDDPGLSDPQGNGYLAYRTPPPLDDECAAVPLLLVVAACAAGLAVIAAPVGAGLLLTTRRTERWSPSSLRR